MSRWAVGADVIEELLASDALQRIQGARTDGQPLLDKAVRTLASSAAIQATDPDSSYTLAYDAARLPAQRSSPSRDFGQPPGWSLRGRTCHARTVQGRVPRFRDVGRWNDNVSSRPPSPP